MEYLDCALQGFKFIASKDTMADHPILFYAFPELTEWCAPAPTAGFVKTGNGRSAAQLHKRPTRDELRAKLNGTSATKKGVRTISEQSCDLGGVTEQTFNILLGETKYLKAIKCTEAHSLILDTTSVPVLANGEQDVVWDNVETVTEGMRLGVYWETEKPVTDQNGNVITLPKGLLRLIGRYWNEDSTYKIKVTAHVGDYIGHTILEVKKPAKLGDDYGSLGNGLRRTAVYDVHGISINLDENIIKAAGQFGISPQILKGQIEKETHFFPSFRWEPFVDVTSIQIDGSSFVNSQYRIIDQSNEGYPQIPVKNIHANVYPHFTWMDTRAHNYLGFVGTAWDFFYNHSSTLNPDVLPHSGDDLYPKNLWYQAPREQYFEIFFSVFTDMLWDDAFLNEEQALNRAHDSANSWLKDTYAKGKFNNTAQTRQACSYGYTQLLYNSAVGDVNYPINDSHLPEFLMETDTSLKYSIFRLLQLISYEKKLQGSGSNNWQEGFEKTYLAILSSYNNWSKRRSQSRYSMPYGIEIINNSKQYHPKGIP